MTIYFDMDGVLCDFKGKISELYGTPFESSMWLDINNQNPHIYRDLQPFWDMVGLVHRLWWEGKDVKILSSLPSMVEMKYAFSDKQTWHKMYMPPINIIITNKAFDKQFYADYNNILVDDSNINIEQWVKRNGLGIHHISYEKTVEVLMNI